MITDFEQFIAARRQRLLAESTQQGVNRTGRHTGKRTREEEIAYGKDSAFNFRFPLAGVTIEPGIHGPAQAKDRRPDLSKDDWKKLHRKVVWYVKDNKIKGGTFLFYNEQMQQGYVASVQKGGREIRIITVLPKGRYDPNMGSKGKTELHLVEEMDYAVWLDDQLILSIDESTLDQLPTVFV
ncbi:hypothetical protein EniLVp02_0244 [Vibrio phage EniLVp02]